MAAAALLMGALTPWAVSADSYDEVGTVADDVVQVHTSEERFRLSAEDDARVVAYAPTGELLMARELPDGEDHEVLLDGEHALVASSGGPVAVETPGDGDVVDVATERDRVALAEANRSSVDKRLTLEVPEGLVGVTGGVEGEARGLVVEAYADGEPVLRVEGDELAEADRALDPSALEADALEVHVTANALDGTLWVELVTPAAFDAHGAPAAPPAEEAATNPAPAIASLAHHPHRVEVEETAHLELDVEHGYVLDVSVYDANGSQAFHVHRGPNVAQAREHCRDLLDCERPWWHDREEAVGPQEIEHTLEQGTYLLYVRAGAVEGNLTLEDPEGDTLIDGAEPVEPSAMEVAGDREVRFDAPLLDVYLDDWGPEALRNVTVTVDGETAYTYEATASGFEFGVDTHRAMQPEHLEAGTVAVTADGHKDPHHEADVYLVTADLDDA